MVQNLGAIAGQGGQPKLLVTQTSFSYQIWQGGSHFRPDRKLKTESLHVYSSELDLNMIYFARAIHNLAGTNTHFDSLFQNHCWANRALGLVEVERGQGSLVPRLLQEPGYEARGQGRFTSVWEERAPCGLVEKWAAGRAREI